MHVYGQGAYHINNVANTLSGTLQYWGSNASSAFVFEKIGRIGETSPLGNASTIRANNYLKVVFTGSTPDVTDRVFEIGPKDVVNTNWKNEQHSLRTCLVPSKIVDLVLQRRLWRRVHLP